MHQLFIFIYHRNIRELPRQIIQFFVYVFRFDEDSPDFFTSTIRSLIIAFILDRQGWSDDTENMEKVGINTLLETGVYKAAYPLHDVSSCIMIYNIYITLFLIIPLCEKNNGRIVGS